MARQDGEFIAGYHGVIHQALWKRILTAGVPRMWFILEIIVSIFLAFCLFMVFRSWVALVPCVLAIAAHIGMMVLMRWDSDFDSVLLYSLKYKGVYHAG
jgi:type IV secretory pathway TrbD component